MPEVKALYHFFDQEACRNRTKGDVFTVTEERADELIKAGLVALTRSFLNQQSMEVNKVDLPFENEASGNAEAVANTEHEHAETGGKRTKTSKKSQKKQ